MAFQIPVQYVTNILQCCYTYVVYRHRLINAYNEADLWKRVPGVMLTQCSLEVPNKRAAGSVYQPPRIFRLLTTVIHV